MINKLFINTYSQNTNRVNNVSFCAKKPKKDMGEKIIKILVKSATNVDNFNTSTSDKIRRGITSALRNEIIPLLEKNSDKSCEKLAKLLKKHLELPDFN